jgi:crotonobetainyl-CoA:carnitine CoA-transferase CaiB-like acyl-CoA transferase
MGPLSGVRIVDMTSVLMGPYATQILGDMGADVIKVEAPQGDIVRQIGPGRNPGMGGMFLNANRSKRSIVIDLKRPAGREALLRLAAGADVLTYNVRPQAMARLGLGYEQLAAVNPRLIYAGLYGYGQDGPYAARPAYDDLIQGASGIPTLVARAGGGTPRYVPVTIADRIVGLFAVNAILGALLHRANSGRGQRIDVPMFETMAGFTMLDHLQGLTFDPPLDRGGYPRLLAPDRRPYQTRDGYICALIYNDKHWASFFKATGQEDKLGDPRYASHAARTRHINEIYEDVARLFQTRTTAEWTALLEAADIPVMPMHDLESILEDPHLTAVDFFRTVEHPSEGPIRSMRVPTQFSDSPAEPERLAPRLGEHTAEVLAEAGYSAAEIETLVAEGAVQAE